MTVNVLNNTAHAISSIAASVTAMLGAGVINVGVLVDGTSNVDGTPFVSDIVTQASNASRTNYSNNGLTPDNNAPYGVTSNSFSSYTFAQETTWYSAMVAGGIINNWAYVPNGGPLPAGTVPPSATCVLLSADSGATSGPGIEFGMTASYKGVGTNSPSAATAVMAGILASLKYNHPSWNWFDIKAALRQTAANWATGYDPTNYGFGAVNFDTATAVGTIYLQPPAVTYTLTSDDIVFTLYPFRQTRRVREEIWYIPGSAALTIKNEWTSADLVALNATLVYQSNGTDVIPIAMATARAGTTNGVSAGVGRMVVFTTDGAGNYSSPQSYNVVPFTAISGAGLIGV